MAWTPPPAMTAEPRSDAWWVENTYRWNVARGRADRLEREREIRLRRLRRRVEKLDEALCLAQGAAEAREHLRRKGFPVEPRAAGEVEVFRRPGRILSVQ